MIKLSRYPMNIKNSRSVLTMIHQHCTEGRYAVFLKNGKMSNFQGIGFNENQCDVSWTIFILSFHLKVVLLEKNNRGKNFRYDCEVHLIIFINCFFLKPIKCENVSLLHFGVWCLPFWYIPDILPKVYKNTHNKENM